MNDAFMHVTMLCPVPDVRDCRLRARCVSQWPTCLRRWFRFCGIRTGLIGILARKDMLTKVCFFRVSNPQAV